MENQDEITTKFKVIGVFFGTSQVNRQNFRCSFCGKLLMTFNGNLEHLHFDAPKADMGNSVDVLCPRCKVIYRIISPVNGSDGVI